MRLSFVRSYLGCQTALVATCCVACVAIRFLVGSDAFSDLGDLAVQAVAAIALIVALIVTARAALAARSRRSRIVLAALPVAMLLLGGAFVKASYADVSCELQALIEAREPNIAEATIVVGPTGQDIRLSGVMREGAAQRLAGLLDGHSGIKRIHLTSEGGLAEAGEAIGDVIAAHGLTTYVPDYCVSACTLAFVRGRERLLQQGARIGFHAPYVEGLFGQLFQDDASAERLAYIAAGVSPDFADKALAVASGDMWFPDNDRLIGAHVATGVVDRYRFPASNLDGTATLAGATDAILHNFSVLQPVATRTPSAFDQIAWSFLEAYRHGASEGEAVDSFKARIAGVLAGLMTETDDGSLIDVARYLTRAMDAATPRTCMAIGAGHDLVRAVAVLGRTDPHAEAEAGALVDRMLRGAKARAGVPRATSPARPLLALSCEDARQAYAHTLGLPEAQAASAIRAMLKTSVATALQAGPVVRDP